jgi:hypothetical protein
LSRESKKGPMCDCYEYDYEDIAISENSEVPQAVVPPLIVQKKRK